MMLWLILIGILLIIYLLERLVLYVNTLTEGYNKILEAILKNNKPESTDDWAGK